MTYAAYTTSELLAAFDAADTYDLNLCAEICARAGLSDEWAAADGDSFESVIDAAVAKLS